MILVRSFAVVALTIVASAPQADACSCPQTFGAIPADGARDVPTNLVQILVEGLYVAPAYELRDVATGQTIALHPAAARALDRMVEIPLGAALAPQTTYELHDTSAGSPRVLTRFTTGAGPDTTPPGAIGVAELRAGRDTLLAADTCGDDVIDLRATLTNLEPGSLLVLRATRDAQTIERTLPAHADAFELIEPPCGGFDIVAGAQYDVTLWARDVAGNDGPVTTRALAVRACAPIASRQDVATGDLTDCALVAEPAEPGDGGGCAAAPGGLLAGMAVLALRRRRRRAS